MRGASGVLAWLAPRAVPGIETLGSAPGSHTYTRSLLGGDGPRVAHAIVRGHGATTSDPDLTHLFDLANGNARAAADAQLTWAARRGRVPALEAAITANPAIAQPGCADPHEMLIRAIVGQQISVVAATKQLALLAGAGDMLAPELAADGVSRLFPTMEQVAAGADRLRGPAAKTATVKAAAGAVASGKIRVARDADLAGMRSELLALKGIGPWTVGYLSLRLGDPDVLLLGDVAVRKGATALGIEDLPRFAADCEGHRSALMLRCWDAASKPSTAD